MHGNWKEDSQGESRNGRGRKVVGEVKELSNDAIKGDRKREESLTEKTGSIIVVVKG